MTVPYYDLEGGSATRQPLRLAPRIETGIPQLHALQTPDISSHLAIPANLTCGRQINITFDSPADKERTSQAHAFLRDQRIPTSRELFDFLKAAEQANATISSEFGGIPRNIVQNFAVCRLLELKAEGKAAAVEIALFDTTSKRGFSAADAAGRHIKFSPNQHIVWFDLDLKALNAGDAKARDEIAALLSHAVCDNCAGKGINSGIIKGDITASKAKELALGNGNGYLEAERLCKKSDTGEVIIEPIRFLARQGALVSIRLGTAHEVSDYYDTVVGGEKLDIDDAACVVLEILQRVCRNSINTAKDLDKSSQALNAKKLNPTSTKNPEQTLTTRAEEITHLKQLHLAITSFIINLESVVQGIAADTKLTPIDAKREKYVRLFTGSAGTLGKLANNIGATIKEIDAGLENGRKELRTFIDAQIAKIKEGYKNTATLGVAVGSVLGLFKFAFTGPKESVYNMTAGCIGAALIIWQCYMYYRMNNKVTLLENRRDSV